MFRILGVTPRSPGCCQATRTWSRKLYGKLQGRPFHQSATLSCSKDDEHHLRASLKTSKSQGSGMSDRQSRIAAWRMQKLSRKTSYLKHTQGDVRDQDVTEDHWKRSLDDGDTFGSLSESPEFEGRSARDDRNFKSNDEQPAAYNNKERISFFKDERNFRREGNSKQKNQNKSYDRQQSKLEDNERESFGKEGRKFERFDNNDRNFKRFDNKDRNFRRLDNDRNFKRFDNNDRNFKKFDKKDRNFRRFDNDRFDDNDRNFKKFDNKDRNFRRFDNDRFDDKDRNFKRFDNNDRNLKRFDRQQPDYEDNERESFRNDGRNFQRFDNNNRNFKKNDDDRRTRHQSDYEDDELQSLRNDDRKFQRFENNDRSFKRYSNNDRNFQRHNRQDSDYTDNERRPFRKDHRNFNRDDRQQSEYGDDERRQPRNDNRPFRSDDRNLKRYERQQSHHTDDERLPSRNDDRRFKRFDQQLSEYGEDERRSFRKDRNFKRYDQQPSDYTDNERKLSRNEDKRFDRFNRQQSDYADKESRPFKKDRTFKRYDQQQSDFSDVEQRSSRNEDRNFTRYDKHQSDNGNVDNKRRSTRNDGWTFKRNDGHRSDYGDVKRQSSVNARHRLAQENEGEDEGDTFGLLSQEGDETTADLYGDDKHQLAQENEGEDEGDTLGLLSQEGDETTADLYGDDKPGTELLQEEMSHKPHIPLGTYNRRHDPNWYARRIIKLGRQGKVREAITVFDQWMIKEDRVKPTVFEFTVLIDILGQVGYTSKAFKLYNQMIRMGIKDVASPHIFTCLFNACANSPWPEDGLTRARNLRTRMLVRGNRPNRIVYNSMIKAFGMCGDINTAFTIADEVAHFYRPDNNLLSSLLVACISDKESGFRHAILVWRKMKKMGVEPELQDYCLLLRAVNECGIGSPEVARDILLDQGAPRARLDTQGPGDENMNVNVNAKVPLESSEKSVRTAQAVKRHQTVKKQKMSRLFGDIDSALSKYVDDTFDDNVEDGAIGVESEAIKGLHESSLDDGEGGMASCDESSLEMDMKSGSKFCENPDNLEWWQMDVFLRPKSTSESAREENALAVNLEDTSVPEVSSVLTASSDDVLDPFVDFSKQGIPTNSVKLRNERLAVIGGYRQILGALHKRGITPDIVFLTQLMLATPPQDEDHLLDEMDMADVKPDITFYNLLLKKRGVRGDDEAVQRLMKLVEEHDLVPDIRTFGCLSLTCDTPKKGSQLLKDLEAAGMEPNIQIMTALLSRTKMKFAYKTFLLQEMERFGIPAERKTLDVIEAHISRAKRLLDMQEKTPNPGVDPSFLANSLSEFIHFYDGWCRRNQLARPDHPWAPYKPREVSNPSTSQDKNENVSLD